jgi:hypothetical protein
MGDGNPFIKNVIGAMIQGIVDHRLAIFRRNKAFCLQRAGSQLYYPLPVGLHNANLNGIGLNKQFFYGHSLFLNIAANNIA